MSQKPSSEKYIEYIAEPLRRRGIGVLPTDTLYGIVGSALNPRVVEQIYALRRRNPKKPMIILIDSISDLAKFGIALSPQIKKILNRVWPGQVSVVLPLVRRKTILEKFKYLHRGTETLAFRMPALNRTRAARTKYFDIHTVLKKTGPLVAPSANFEGEPPAKTIAAAKKYFKENIDFYVDVGKLTAKPSTIIEIKEGKIVVLRQGAVKIFS